MAADTMLRFVTTPQSYPDKRPAELRAEDFREIANRYAVPSAEEQAGRCSQCGVPYCTVHCPLHNHIPDWLRLTAEGRLREAYELSNATSTMPEICGRICPQDRLCEGNCVIEFSGHGAVTIGSVEKFITDKAWEEGWVEPLVPGPARTFSAVVAIAVSACAAPAVASKAPPASKVLNSGVIGVELLNSECAVRRAPSAPAETSYARWRRMRAIRSANALSRSSVQVRASLSA